MKTFCLRGPHNAANCRMWRYVLSPSPFSHVRVPSTAVIQVGRELELEALEKPLKQIRARDMMAMSDIHEDEEL